MPAGEPGVPAREVNNLQLQRFPLLVASQSCHTTGNRFSLASAKAAHISKTNLLGEIFLYIYIIIHTLSQTIKI